MIALRSENRLYMDDSWKESGRCLAQSVMLCMTPSESSSTDNLLKPVERLHNRQVLQPRGAWMSRLLNGHAMNSYPVAFHSWMHVQNTQ